jgi:DNA end-binding protein Ku
MAARANWKGYLKLSLVSCAVALFPATTINERTRFNIINRNTGNRIHNQVVDAETGDIVEKEDRVKGYHVEDDNYILLDDDELDNVALESTHTIDIDAFIPRKEVDEIYLDESFYIVPNDKVAQDAFAVIREGMRKRDMVGLARLVIHRRERLLMLQPRGKGLVATALRYVNEVRDEDTYFDDIPNVKISSEMLDLAIHIIDSKKAHFDPSKFKDRYEDALKTLIKSKAAGKAPPTPPRHKPSNVVNLMDALRRSISTKSPGKKSASAAKATKEKAKRTVQRRIANKRVTKKAG